MAPVPRRGRRRIAQDARPSPDAPIVAPGRGGSLQVPQQAGPVPDKLSIWPMDDGRYGLDATFQGASGYERADAHRRGLNAEGVPHSFRQELTGGWTLRFGPLTAIEVAQALGAFVY